jgi:dihydrolipoamide dehydrogenase
MINVEVKVPDIGDFKDVEVIEVLVKPGDRVEKEQSLVSLESDKATMEIPSPAAGVVKSIAVKIGDKVSEGVPILVLDEIAGAPAVAPPKPASPPAQVAASPMLGAPAGRSAAPITPATMLVLGSGGGCSARSVGLGMNRCWSALPDPRRRVPERRLHPVEGAATLPR